MSSSLTRRAFAFKCFFGAGVDMAIGILSHKWLETRSGDKPPADWRKPTI